MTEIYKKKKRKKKEKKGKLSWNIERRFGEVSGGGREANLVGIPQDFLKYVKSLNQN